MYVRFSAPVQIACSDHQARENNMSHTVKSISPQRFLVSVIIIINISQLIEEVNRHACLEKTI